MFDSAVISFIAALPDKLRNRKWKSAYDPRRTSRRRMRNNLPFLLDLESRLLASGTPAPSAAIGPLDQGLRAIRSDLPAMLAAANQESADTPLIQQALFTSPQVLSRLQGALNVSVNANSVDATVAAFQRAGFSHVANGDLLRFSGQFSWSWDQSLAAGGQSGFAYFDKSGDGDLNGSISAHETMTAKLVVGVDVVSGKPTFYLGDGSIINLAVSGSGNVSGNFNIGALTGVILTSGTGTVTVANTIKFLDSDGDHKLRLPDFDNAHLGATVDGALTGTAAINNMKLSTSVSGVGLNWTGAASHVVNDNHASSSVTLNTPDALQFLRNEANNLYLQINGLNWLHDADSLLATKIPVWGKSIGDALKLTDKVDTIELLTNPHFETASNLADLANKATAAGISPGFTASNANNLMLQVVQGQNVDFYKVNHSGSIPIWSGSTTVPLLDVEFLGGLASASLNAHFGAGIALGYTIDYGIATHGMWVGDDSHVALTGTLSAGIDGNVGLLWHSVSAGASGDLTLNLNLGLSVVDQTPADQRIYQADLPGTGNFAQLIMANALATYYDVSLSLGISAKVKGPLGVTLYKWGRSIPLSTLVHSNHQPGTPFNSTNGRIAVISSDS